MIRNTAGLVIFVLMLAGIAGIVVANVRRMRRQFTLADLAGVVLGPVCALAAGFVLLALAQELSRILDPVPYATLRSQDVPGLMFLAAIAGFGIAAGWRACVGLPGAGGWAGLCRALLVGVAAGAVLVALVFPLVYVGLFRTSHAPATLARDYVEGLCIVLGVVSAILVSVATGRRLKAGFDAEVLVLGIAGGVCALIAGFALLLVANIAMGPMISPARWLEPTGRDLGIALAAALVGGSAAGVACRALMGGPGLLDDIVSGAGLGLAGSSMALLTGFGMSLARRGPGPGLDDPTNANGLIALLVMLVLFGGAAVFGGRSPRPGRALYGCLGVAGAGVAAWGGATLASGMHSYASRGTHVGQIDVQYITQPFVTLGSLALGALALAMGLYLYVRCFLRV